MRIHPSARAFAHADGTPVFWLADSVWAAPAHATLEEWRRPSETKMPFWS
jgi:hypothetical protein